MFFSVDRVVKRAMEEGDDKKIMTQSDRFTGDARQRIVLAARVAWLEWRRVGITRLSWALLARAGRRQCG